MALFAASAALFVGCSTPTGQTTTIPHTAANGQTRAVHDVTPYPVCTAADPDCGVPPNGGTNPDGTPCTAAGNPACDTSSDPFGPLRPPTVPSWYTPQCADEYGLLNRVAWHQCYNRQLWVN
jgi:hypothetical protein